MQNFMLFKSKKKCIQNVKNQKKQEKFKNELTHFKSFHSLLLSLRTDFF